jgi:mitochondrial pyruvate carrier 2
MRMPRSVVTRPLQKLCKTSALCAFQCNSFRLVGFTSIFAHGRTLRYFQACARPVRGQSSEATNEANMATFGSRLKSLWNHPAGPKTIFFWAPTFKWGISIANISDLQRNPDEVSLPMQLAVTATGLIWSKYSLDITPKNYNLLAVNAFMAMTGMVQLYRKYDHNQQKSKLTAVEPKTSM